MKKVGQNSSYEITHRLGICRKKRGLVLAPKKKSGALAKGRS